MPMWLKWIVVYSHSRAPLAPALFGYMHKREPAGVSFECAARENGWKVISLCANSLALRVYWGDLRRDKDALDFLDCSFVWKAEGALASETIALQIVVWCCFRAYIFKSNIKLLQFLDFHASDSYSKNGTMIDNFSAQIVETSNFR